MGPAEQRRGIEWDAHAITRARRLSMRERQRERRSRAILGAIAVGSTVVAFSAWGWAMHLPRPAMPEAHAGTAAP